MCRAAAHRHRRLRGHRHPAREPAPDAPARASKPGRPEPGNAGRRVPGVRRVPRHPFEDVLRHRFRELVLAHEHSATVNSVLTQDAVSTNTIPVDTNSPNPVAAFLNQNSGGVSGNAQMEGLGLVTPDGASSPQLSHIARSSVSPSGWVVSAIGGGISASVWRLPSPRGSSMPARAAVPARCCR